MGWFSKKKPEGNTDAESFLSLSTPPPSYRSNASTPSLAPSSSSASTYSSTSTQQTPSYGAPPATNRMAAGSNPYASITARYGNGDAKPEAEKPSYGAPTTYGGPGGRAPYGSQQPNRPPYGSTQSDAGPTRPTQYGQTGPTDNTNTPEDDEDEDVECIKREIRFVKTETVNHTRNALRAAQQAEDTGRDTLERLGRQGEMLFQAEKHLDVAATSNRTAEEQARELKTLNRSMFAVHVKNPFNSQERQKQREQDILARHEEEKGVREATRQREYAARGAYGGGMRGGYGQQQGAAGGRGGYGGGQRNLAERSKYQFEANESDDEIENEIDDNLDQLAAAARRLNVMARTTNQVVDQQINQINGIEKKADKVTAQTVLNTKRLEKIR